MVNCKQSVTMPFYCAGNLHNPTSIFSCGNTELAWNLVPDGQKKNSFGKMMQSFLLNLGLTVTATCSMLFSGTFIFATVFKMNVDLEPWLQASLERWKARSRPLQGAQLSRRLPCTPPPGQVSPVLPWPRMLLHGINIAAEEKKTSERKAFSSVNFVLKTMKTSTPPLSIWEKHFFSEINMQAIVVIFWQLSCSELQTKPAKPGRGHDQSAADRIAEWK